MNGWLGNPSGLMFRRIGFHIGWEPRDWWIGAYFTKPYDETFNRVYSVYLILIPTLYVRVFWHRRVHEK